MNPKKAQGWLSLGICPWAFAIALAFAGALAAEEPPRVHVDWAEACEEARKTQRLIFVVLRCKH